MKTHERNVLIWLVTRRWARVAVWIAIVILGAIILFGCAKTPTASTEAGHPNEELIASYSQCYYKWAGLEKRGPLTVFFTDEHKTTTNGCEAEEGTCDIAGWATLPNTITYWRGWVRRNHSHWDLEWNAAHEVGHLAGYLRHEYDKREGDISAEQWASWATGTVRSEGGCGSQDE